MSGFSSTGLALLGVVAAFHLVDLWFGVPPAAFVFRARRGRWTWADARTVGVQLARGRRLVFSTLLPTRPVAVLEHPGLRLGPTGVMVDPAAPLPEAPPLATEAPLPYPDLTLHAERGWLQLTADTRILCGSPRAARRAALEVDRVTRTVPAEREAAARALLADSLDLESLDERLALWRRVARPLAWAALLASIGLYGTGAALTFGAGRGLSPWLLVTAWGLLLGTVQASFWAAHRALFPEDRRARVQGVLGMILSPADALTAPQALGREALAGYHPLALARLVGSEAAFEALAGRLLRGLRSAGDAWGTDALEAWLRDQGLDPERLVAPPEAAPGTNAWCPRCHAQFTEVTAPCPDCRGAGLVARGEPA